MTIKTCLAVLCGSCAIAAAMPAMAQNTSSGGDLDEIIVTARKRQESIMKVPVVTTVVSEAKLTNAGITDIQRLTTRVPGLLLGSASLAIGPQISLRGIGTSAQDAGIDQSVSLNLDGLSIAQGLALRSGLFDVAQIEVLRGPQSLFYGKASTGGVISIRTNDPGDRAEIIARTAYDFEARDWKSDLVVSTPLTDSFGIRLAGQYDAMQGFFKNKAIGVPSQGSLSPKYKRVDHTRFYQGRVTAKWEPTSDFSVRVKANITREHVLGNASNGQLTFCPEGLGAVPGNPQFLSQLDNCKLDRQFNFIDLLPSAYPGIPNGGVAFLLQKQKFGTVELNYKGIEGINLTSVTGYYRLSTDTYTNSGLGSAGSYFVTDNTFDRKDFTQEFRADTDFGGPFDFTAGLYYQDAKVQMIVQRYINTLVTPNPSRVGLNGGATTGRHNYPIRTYSAFGQARYKIVPEFEIAAGVRYTDEKRTDQLTNLTPGAANGTATPVNVPIGPRDPATGLSLLKPKIASKTWSPELTLTWTPTDDLTVFGSIKKGRKSGGFTLTQLYAPNFNNSFQDEKVQGGEAGIKTRLFDRTLQMNVAGYYYKYKGLQVGASDRDPVTGATIARTVNAGGVRIYGIDFDFTYRAPTIEGLSITGSVNWLNGKFTELNNVPCTGGQTFAEGCNGNINAATGRGTTQNLPGLKLLRGPEWVIQGGFDYETAFNDDLNVRFGWDYQYTSTYRAALNRLNATRQKAYALVNANIAVEAADKAWELALISNNITNRIVTSNCTSAGFAVNSVGPGTITGGPARGVAGLDEVSCVPRRGREIWVRLTVRPMGLFGK
jgi:iron complex outermembrane recepter protein